MRILIDSIYINNSGGFVLLDYLVREVTRNELDVFFLMDARCHGRFPFLHKDRVSFINASLWRRHMFYHRYGARFSKILCFGNIPPTVKVPGTVFCYFHNVLFFEQPDSYPLNRKFFFFLKRLVIRFSKANTNFFVVQSCNVKSLLLERLKVSSGSCLVIPFYSPINSLPRIEGNDSFAYICNGNPHKNHVNLLEAWKILSDKGYSLPLHLTVTEHYVEICELIDRYRAQGVNIVNHGFVTASELYAKVKFVVYPSFTESFGLGLVESVSCGVEVVAADLPYVHAVIEPIATFDPWQPMSIVSAVIDALRLKQCSGERLITQLKVSNNIGKLLALLN